METLTIEILNPEVKELLQNLAKMDLIRIKEDSSPMEFNALLEKLRSNADNAPTYEEISEEVEVVREKRNGTD